MLKDARRPFIQHYEVKFTEAEYVVGVADVGTGQFLLFAIFRPVRCAVTSIMARAGERQCPLPPVFFVCFH